MFCCKKKKKRKENCAPVLFRENPYFDMKARLARMCLCAGRVVRVAKLRTLLASFSRTVRHCYSCTCPVSRGPVSLNACNARPALAFLVINKRVPCYLEVSVLSAITSALKRKDNTHWSFLSQWGAACTYLFLCCCTLSLSSLSLFPPDYSSRKRTLYI